LFEWFGNGGAAAVAAWLRDRDLSHFNPKAQIQRTSGWEAVASTWGEPEDAVAQALELLENPEVVFGAELLQVQFDGREEIQAMLKSPRKIGHRMQRAGYIAMAPRNAQRWIFKKDGRVFRSRLAFVLAAKSSDQDQARELIKQRGIGIAASMFGEPET
jgi:hypothetical protein